VHPPGDHIGFTVSIGSQDVSGFRAAAVRIIEQSRHFDLFPEGTSLCKIEQPAPVPKSATALDSCIQITAALTKESSVSLLLRPLGDRIPTAGHFSGAVTFVSNGFPTGQTINVELYITTWWHRTLGILVILIGAIFGWSISTWARNRYNRGQLLLPAVFARERLQALTRVLAETPQSIPPTSLVNTTGKIDSLTKSLSEDALEAAHYIPPAMPSPGPGTPLRMDDYSHFLSNVNSWIVVLETVIGRMPRAWQFIGQNGITPVQVATALATMDQLAAGDVAPAAAVVETALKAALEPLTAAAPKVLPAAGAAPAPLQTFQQLRVQLAHTSWLIWAGTIVVTTLAGTYVIVLSNLGFGVSTDYIACAFFGLGLPTGAAMLQQTAQSVSASLGVTVK
jgi:hypothetical protein